MSHYHQLGQTETIEELQRIQFDEWVKSKERFVVRVGKFGCYIYDSKRNRDISLSETVQFLNMIGNTGINSKRSAIFTEKEILLIEGVRLLSDVDKKQLKDNIVGKLSEIESMIRKIMLSNIFNDKKIQIQLTKILMHVADM